MSNKKVRVYDEKNDVDWGKFDYIEEDIEIDKKYGLKVYEVLNTTSFFMKLFDDESVQEKLKFMNPGEVLFDDKRNEESDTYYDIMDNMKPGQSVRITVELLEEN